MNSIIPNDDSISPISRLLPEILSLVFIEYMNLPRSIGYGSQHDLRLGPLYLASVCQSWREVACGTSELWTTCWLNYSQTQLNSIWLSRIGTRQFDILDGATWEREETPFPINPVLSSIAPYMGRCRSFAITYSILSGVKSKKYTFRAPNLISCAVEAVQEASSPWLTNFLFHATKLETLEMDVLPNRFRTSSVNFKTLSLYICPPLETLLSVLKEATSLRNLIINDPFEVGSDSSDIDIVHTHTSLAHLDLSFDCIDDMIMLFDPLTFPSLNSLTVHVDCETVESEHILHFCAFLRRSQCSLEEFVLDGDAGQGDSLLAHSLRHAALSSLQMLTISNFTLEESLLRLLSSVSGLSCLRKLHFRNVSISGGGWEPRLLTDMLVARRTPLAVEGSGRSSIPTLEHFTLSPNKQRRCDPFWAERYAAEILCIKTLCRSGRDPTRHFVAELGNFVIR